MTTTANDPKYPHITVKLTGEDSNGAFIIGRVRTALKRGKVPAAEIGEFSQEAMSGDYDNLLATVMRWVNVT